MREGFEILHLYGRELVMNSDLDFHKYVVCNLISELKEGSGAAQLNAKYQQLSGDSMLVQQLMKLLVVEGGTEKAAIQNKVKTLVERLVKNPTFAYNAEDKEFYSLKKLSFRVYEILRDGRNIHYEEICNRLFAGMDGNEANVRKRVYDVLNVLVAAGLFCKEHNKHFCLNRRWNKGSILRKREQINLLLEENELKQKLVLRNMGNQAGASVFPLPVLCFRVVGKYWYSLANKGKTSQLTLESNVPIETVQELALLKKVRYRV